MPGQFEIAILDTQGAAGTIYATFEIRNASTTDCTENGYAKLQMLTSGGGLLKTTWSNDNSLASPTTTDLPPGTAALGACRRVGPRIFPRLVDRRHVLRRPGRATEVLAGDTPDIALPDRRS